MRLARLALAALALVALPANADTALDPKQSVADFDAVWKAIDRDYAYHGESRAAWKRARDTWRPRAKTASRIELAAALDGLLSTLRDENVALAQPFPGLPRAVPEEADIWARWRDGAAVIEAVRIFGDGDVAGLKPGDVIVSVDGVAIDRAVNERLRGSAANAAARDWALRASSPVRAQGRCASRWRPRAAGGSPWWSAAAPHPRCRRRCLPAAWAMRATSATCT